MLRLSIILVILCVGFISAEKPAVHLVPEKIAAILPQMMECIAETGVDLELLVKLRSGEVTDKDKDPKFPKFIHCGLSKSGIAKKNGLMDVEKLLDFFPSSTDKEIIKKAIEECNKEGKDPVDTTFQFAKCFQKKAPVKIMF